MATTKRSVSLAKRGVRQIRQSGIGKLAVEGSQAAAEVYGAMKTKVAQIKRKRAVKRVAKTTMKVAGEAAKVAALTGAVAAIVATAREVRKSRTPA